MGSTYVIIGIVLAIVLVIILLLLWGNHRRKSKLISFGEQEQPQRELTQQEKSGNYQAKQGFQFASAAPAREKQPVVREEPHSGREDLRSTPQPPLDQPNLASKLPEQDSQHSEAEVPATSERPENQIAEDPQEGLAALGGDAQREETREETREDASGNREGVDKLTATDHAPERDRKEFSTPELKTAESEETDEEDGSHGEETGDSAQSKRKAEAAEAAEAAATQVESAAEAKEVTPVPEEPVTPSQRQEPEEDIAPAAGRIGRLRGRLSRSQNAIGKSVLGILSAGDLDEDAWEEIEDTLYMADLGSVATEKVMDNLRTRIAESGVANEAQARSMLRECLIEAAKPDMDRSIRAVPSEGKPAVVLVVGVNGTGKTTTVGKLARVLVSMGHSVLLGAADTFRAAAADQLETWGRRAGATTIRGAEGADPASVAFDAVAQGVKERADVVLVDTAGRLHTSKGLMDQLGKVKRVVEKKAHVDEVLLVLDATVGQNGLMQARIFRDVVDITGVVLTKLDGTAKGGIVFQVQEELGVPVKLVGLGEGADDLAPFEVEGFVDALLG
ncbi:signal recognition particle-docking protein FtsY [Corynebacterium poyangense]|uniref:Signal recognition particle receptor FtsY n=1 Tax=Corynebacterium poyangense TaxID=2684405 RepID=A0A7H0SPL9_9CORY|nr:signal recognition particle-docking protein FtsY [Corynebacterium poyangense]QNQ90494.1 signal recognition particle-docking protein FtsY [Corynebacterium poyangense]